MYPTYIPVPAPPNATSNRYALYLYHEGWKKIDYQLHLVKLSGVPVLFIPGNGGSYKQVWSLNFFSFFLLPLDLVLRTRGGLLLGFLGLGFSNTQICC
jgi:hypothetical protein